MEAKRRSAMHPVGSTHRAICTECDWHAAALSAESSARNHVAHFGHDVVVLTMTTAYVTLVPEPEKAKP